MSLENRLDVAKNEVKKIVSALKNNFNIKLYKFSDSVEELKKGKKFEELNLKPFFRLHPPRKGIKSKLHFPKGVLGDNKKKINDLVERML